MTETVFLTAAQVSDVFTRIVEENKQLRAQIAAGSTSSAAKRTNKPKLTRRDVEMMRKLKRLGSTNQELATAYDCNPSTVSRTIRGIYWK